MIFTQKIILLQHTPDLRHLLHGSGIRLVKRQGGVAALQKINERKAAILYDFLDQSELFRGTVVKKDRSLMNAPFVLPHEGAG